MKVFIHLFFSNLKYNKIELGISYFITTVILVLFNIFRNPKATDNDFLFSIAFYAMLYAFYTNRRKFNLKYLLSLPLSKSQLIMAKSSSDFVYFVPAILLAFTGVIHSKHEFSAFPLIIILFQVVMFVAFIIFDSDIEQPRLENAKSSFLNRLIYVRKGMDFIFFGVFVVYLAIAINLTPFEMPIKQYFLIIFLTVALNYKFNRTLRLLRDESYSYFIPKRDLLTITKKISIFGIIGLLFMFTGLSLPTKYGKDKIYSLIHRNKVNEVIELSKNYNQNKFSEKGFTPLTAALREGKLELIKELVNNGVSLTSNTKTKHGKDAIELAILSGNLELVDYLVLNLNFDARRRKEKSLRTALHQSANSCSPEMIDYFIDKGVDLNKQDFEGHTALTIASMKKCSTGVMVLLEEGANPLIKNNKNKVASAYVKSKKLKYLFQRKVKNFKNQVEPKGGTYRSLASERELNTTSVMPKESREQL